MTRRTRSSARAATAGRGGAAARASTTTAGSHAAVDRATSHVERASALTIGLLLTLTPIVVIPDAKEAFRLVQGLTGGWLGLASLAIASWTLRDAGTVSVDALWRRSAIRALVPLAAVVGAGVFFTAHPIHFRAAAADFAIGAACIAGWSLALRAATLRRLLAWSIVPATIVALLGLDQVGGWLGLLDWLPIQAATERLRITSTVGNPGDLAALMVLPVLVALHEWRDAPPRMRAALGVALALMLAMLAVTATLAAAAAVVSGALAWLLLSLSRLWPSAAHRWMRPAAAVALTTIVIAGLIAIATPLRTRVAEKIAHVARGDVNALLTGRLDGWRAAWSMVTRAPMTGVGQGAFRAEFADTRLALTNQGVPFYAEQTNVLLATPHNELLSVAAEQGWPGVMALAWALWCLGAAAFAAATFGAATLTVRPAATGALVWAGLIAFAALCVFSFPLHVPAVAWPWLVFLAWIFRQADERAELRNDAPPMHQSPAPPSPLDTPPTRSSSNSSNSIGSRLGTGAIGGVSGRALFPLVLAVTIAALAWQTMRVRDRVSAGRLLARVEARTIAALQARRAPSTLFAEHLDWLDLAARRDPLEIGVPIARGTQFLLLRRPDEALTAYREAAALEPRPEIDLNIGRALWMRGDRDEARRAFRRAVTINPHLRREVPDDGLD